MAEQLRVSAADLGFYEWSGRSIERHRAEIREALGFRECSVADADKLTDWLVANVTQAQRRADQVRADLLQRCREEGIEPPSPGRIERIVRSALHQGEQLSFTRIAARLPTEVCARLDALVTAVPNAPGETVDEREVLAWVKTDPGRLSLNTMLDEIAKLEAIRSLQLPEGLLGDVAGKVVAAWRARAAVQAPSHLRELGPEARWSVLAALLVLRQQEITDNLVELLVSTVHTIGARADRRVTEEMVSTFKRVRNKQHMLHRVAEAALDRPDETVRSVVFPVAGGEQTLRDVVAEFKASSPQFRKNVQVKLRGSYSNHYRRGLLKLVQTLQFRSNNTMHAPIIDGIELVRRYADSSTQTYRRGEQVPIRGVVGGDWLELLYRGEVTTSRIQRSVYELCLFTALREQLRCKEIWVEGADKWRNPEADLPADFETRRVEHYRSLSKPLDPAEFIEPLRAQIRDELLCLQ